MVDLLYSKYLMAIFAHARTSQAALLAPRAMLLSQWPFSSLYYEIGQSEMLTDVIYVALSLI